MNKETQTTEVVTKKDLTKAAVRYMFMACNTYNYENHQGPAVVFGLEKVLRKIHKNNDDDYVASLNNHFKYFNTTTWMANILLGASVAMEEKDGVKSKDAVNGIKTGLMGPFAPLGDSIFGSLVPAIMGSIAATLAIAGNPAGIFLWIAVAVAYDIFRWKQLEFAYKEGVNLINNMQSTLTALIDAAAVLGIFMVGALIASMIGVEVSWTPHIWGQSD